jgi:hypothetical protein
MAHDLDTRRAVRSSYVFEQLSLEVAALKNDIPMGTARNWKRAAFKEGDDWDKARAAQISAAGGEGVIRQVLAAVMTQTQSTLEEIQTNPDMSPMVKVQMLASLADSFSKMSSMSKRMMPETDKLGVGMDVLHKFAEYTGKKYPKHAAALLEVLEPFGEELAKLYG